MSEIVPLSAIREAEARVAPGIWRTPLLPFDRDGGPRLWLKAESLQRTGAFKIRGASNKIRRWAEEARARGVVTYSSGNHAQGVACAARDVGARAIVITLDHAVPHKIAGAQRWGAEVRRGGPTSLRIRQVAEALAAETGALLVPPFDDPDVIAGQGTCGLEIVAELPEVATVIVPIGGGGLISGVATAVKSLRPGARVVGVEPEGACAALRSRAAGTVVTLDRVDTIADGLMPLSICERTFAHMQRYVDDVVTVPDAEIVATARRLLAERKLCVEPSGAAALAALLHGRIPEPAGPAVVVLTGGNADLRLLVE